MNLIIKNRICVTYSFTKKKEMLEVFTSAQILKESRNARARKK